MSDFFRRTGLLPGTAFIVASGAPAATIRQARILKARYGALIQICDGTADQVGIQAAIDALPANGGTIKLSEGSFNINATIVIKKHAVFISGQGPYATTITLADGSNCNMFHFTGLGGVRQAFGGLSMLWLYGNRTEQASGHGIVVDAADGQHGDVTCTDLYISAMKQNGVRLLTDGLHKFTNCWVENNEGYAVYITGLSGSAYFTHCEFHSSAGPAIYVGPYVSGSSSVIFESPFILNKAGADLAAIYLKGAHQVFINNITAYGAWETNPAADLILVENCYDIYIRDGLMDGAAKIRYGINIIGTSNWVHVGGLRISGFITAPLVSGAANVGGKIWNHYSDLFMDVLAASATHLLNAQDVSAYVGGETPAIVAQPDVPRNITVTAFDAAAGAPVLTMSIIITGVDAKGNIVSETFATSGSETKTGNVAFATVTSQEVDVIAGNGAGDTLSVGIGIKLGLSNKIYATTDVYKIKKNNTNALVAIAQVNTTYDTYDMAVIGLVAGDDFTVWFKSNLNVVA